MTGEKFTFQIERDELKQIKQAAKARNMSASEFVRTACKEKIDTQSVVLPILFDTRDELTSRMTELERIVMTNCAVFERAQESLNDALAKRLIDGHIASYVDLRERLAEEFDDTAAWKEKVLATIKADLAKHAEIMKGTIVAQAETIEKSYRRIKRVDETMQKQASGTWSKKLTDALAKPKS